MSHTLANLEYHHFKYDGFRRPGDLHIHYFGTATLSIADNVKTAGRRRVRDLGRPLRRAAAQPAEGREGGPQAGQRQGAVKRSPLPREEASMTTDFIALDWGTTSFRAYRVAADGHVHDTISAPEGILAVKDGAFEAALERLIGAWDVTLPVMAAGMITSRQGWIELPYLPCPASAADLARALHMHTTASGRRIAFATGLSYRAPDGMPDVMRSEEVQVFGSLDLGLNHFVTPGTHSKWITTRASSSSAIPPM